jgi:hypothetical protein
MAKTDAPSAQLQAYLEALTSQNSQILFALELLVENTSARSADANEKARLNLEKAYVNLTLERDKGKNRLDLETRRNIGIKLDAQEKRRSKRADITQRNRLLQKQTNATIRIGNAHIKSMEKLAATKTAGDVLKTEKRLELEEEKRRTALDVLEVKKELNEQKTANTITVQKEKETATRETVALKIEQQKRLVEFRKAANLAEVPKLALERKRIKQAISLSEKQSILDTIKGVGTASPIVDKPVFLQFLNKQEKYGNALLLGNKEEHAIGLEVLKAVTKLRVDNKENIDKLIEEQKKAQRKPFEDSMAALSKKGGLRGAVGADMLHVARGIADAQWLIGGVKKILGVPAIAAAASGLMIAAAGVGGYALGTVINEKLGISKWVADNLAGKFETGQQVLGREAESKNLRITARDELLREYENKLDALSKFKKNEAGEFVPVRSDLSNEQRTRLRHDTQKQINLLLEERKRLTQRGSEPVIDRAEVLERQRLIGARQRPSVSGIPKVAKSATVKIPTKATASEATTSGAAAITVTVGVPEEFIEASESAPAIVVQPGKIKQSQPSQAQVAEMMRNASQAEREAAREATRGIGQTGPNAQTTIINNSTSNIGLGTAPKTEVELYK